MSSGRNVALQPEPHRLYADVIVPRHLAKAFTYLVPSALAPTITIGQRVLIPFGHMTLEGAVVALSPRVPPGMDAARLKEIRSLAEGTPEISPALFELSRKVADEYLAPWGQCLRLILPPAPSPAASVARLVATDQGNAALSAESCPETLRPLLARIARRSKGVLASTIEKEKRPKLRQLEERGWVTIHEQTVSPATTLGTKPGAAMLPPGSPHSIPIGEPDSSWVKRLDTALQAGTSNTILVHAPLELRLGLLLQTVSQARKREQSVLVLAGEVARVEWLGRLLTECANLPVTLLHGDLDEHTRLNRWNHIRDGATTIVVGTRSAVFAPLRSLGLIWIDAEEDPALKEPQEPRYHARDVARMRAQAERALLVLGSSHPSLESYAANGIETLRAETTGPSDPTVELVDLRREPSGSPFSSTLLNAMRNAIERKDRVVLFLNRKGFAGALVCRDCGWVPRCPSCAVALSYSRRTAALTCRYCGTSGALPDTCPSCGAARFSPVGRGTEQVEAEATRLFPDATIVRLDSETLRGTAAIRTLWNTVASGRWDILVGTQALFQREPLEPVGLVGIVQADSGLHLPNFRAAERMYHLLGETAGLARPAAAGGRVIVQTLLPSHHAIQSLATKTPSRFYEEELATRRLLGYPPVLHLVGLSIVGKQASVIERAAQRIVEQIAHLAAADTSRPSQIATLGPVPAAGGRAGGQQRRQLLVKGPDRTKLHDVVRAAVEATERAQQRARIKVIVDVDPIEMG